MVRSLGNYISLARPYNAILPLVAVVAGYVMSGASNLQRGVMVLLITLLLHSVVTVWNDIVDADDDKHNRIYRIRDIKAAGQYSYLIFWQCTAIVLAIICVLQVTLPLTIILAILYLGLGWLYNSVPFRVSKRPIGSMVVLGLAYGYFPVLLGASIGGLNETVIVLGFGWALNRLSLSLLKDYKDAIGDVKSKKKTFLLVYGGTTTELVSLGLMIFGLAVVIAVVFSLHKDMRPLVAVLLVAAWLLSERLQLFRQRDYIGLNHVFHRCLHYQLVFDVAAVSWLSI